MISVIENIMLPMDFCRTYPMNERRKRAMELLELVELADHAHKLPTALSGGQQQRVAIARALANDPPVVIADEPTGNLDSKTAESVFALFNDLVAKGKTIIIVTHDSGLAKRTHRTALIADGEIVNEYVAKAMPTLTASQLLQATKTAKILTYEAGAMILAEGTNAVLHRVQDGRSDPAAPNQSDVIALQLGSDASAKWVFTRRNIARPSAHRRRDCGGACHRYEQLSELLDQSRRRMALRQMANKHAGGIYPGEGSHHDRQPLEKVWADFAGLRGRTLLTIMTIAVGAFAVGFNSNLGLYGNAGQGYLSRTI